MTAAKGSEAAKKIANYYRNEFKNPKNAESLIEDIQAALDEAAKGKEELIEKLRNEVLRKIEPPKNSHGWEAVCHEQLIEIAALKEQRKECHKKLCEAGIYTHLDGELNLLQRVNMAVEMITALKSSRAQAEARIKYLEYGIKSECYCEKLHPDYGGKCGMCSLLDAALKDGEGKDNG